LFVTVNIVLNAIQEFFVIFVMRALRLSGYKIEIKKEFKNTKEKEEFSEKVTNFKEAMLKGRL